jgi:hypothetical protein
MILFFGKVERFDRRFSSVAIADFEQKNGMEVNGRASVKVLEALKR